MKHIFLILFVNIIYLSDLSASNDRTLPKFAISSVCVTSVELTQRGSRWDLSITLNKASAKEMAKFTNANIQRIVSFTNGTGVVISTTKLLGEFSNRFIITGSESKSDTQKIKQKITDSVAECGIVNKPL